MTIVIGRDGYVCALAIRDTAGSATAPAARYRNFRRPMPVAIRHVPNWDHARCNLGKNITPQSAGLALAAVAAV
jgi:hypothetical protein